MMGLKDIGSTLPPGFRFYPSDDELVCHYLYKKIATNEQVLNASTLVEIDLHTCEPWQLPDMAKLNASEWYFFSFRDRKYATGFRTNRATTSGYWKATGKDRMVVDPKTRQIVGMRKTLVFHMNRAPNGIKTGWIMHEFRLETPHMPPKEDWVLCRVFHKRKEENSNKQNPQLVFDTSIDVPCLSLSGYPLTSKNLPSGYQQVTSYSSISTHHQQHNSQDKYTNCLTEINSDEYSFLWNVNLHQNAKSLEDQGVPSNMDEIKFEIDNNMVFL